MPRYRNTGSGEQREPCCYPVIIGSDTELTNFMLGGYSGWGTADMAAQALLREITGFPREARSHWSRAANESSGQWQSDDNREYAADWSSSEGDRPVETLYNPRDWGRKYLISGGCAYIDLGHLEICTPEVTNAYDFVAAWHALLRIADDARQAANSRLPKGQEFIVTANSSDGCGNSFGAHMNFLLPRRTWDDIFYRKSLYLPCLASFQVSSIVMTGQGKVGSENGRPPVDYQLSQRMDFFERLSGPQTMYHRPLVNSRDEPLCGTTSCQFDGQSPASTMARLHVITADANLCHSACVLKTGTMQIILAMLQRDRVNTGMILEDPVQAAVRISHDPTLQARVRTISGQNLTAVELQMRFMEEAKSFVAAGGCKGLVPRCEEILDLWEDTLTKLMAGDCVSLRARLDWVLKKWLLEQAMKRHPGLTWASQEIRYLDNLYSSLNLNQGLYWACERDGMVDRVASPGEIERFTQEPPADTRAWTRGRLLRTLGDCVEDVDWDRVTLRAPGDGYSGKYWWIDFADPAAFTRAQTETIFNQATDVDVLLDKLSRSCLQGRDHGMRTQPGELLTSGVKLVLPERMGQACAGPIHTQQTGVSQGEYHESA